MKCVAYCRVSSDKDEQINSLQNQIKHYTELFQKEGYEGAECGMYYSRENRKETIRHIKSIFADEGISGTKLKNREAFKYMLECAYRKEFDIIYVKNIQRWARSVEDGAGILKKLKVIGIKVIFEDGNLNNFDHEMTINILLSTAQEESRAKGVAVKFGIRRAQNDGKFISGTPYGYTRENGYLKIIPEEAKIIKEIFELYANQGWGATRISRFLNSQNIPTKKGRKWSQQQILDIINNELYNGIQKTHRYENTDVNIDKVTHIDEKSQKEYKYTSRIKVDESEWIIKNIEDIKIISDDLYEKVALENQRRKELNKQNIRKSTKHIFSNLLYCFYCGRALRRKKLCTWVRKDGTRDLKYEWICTNYDMYHNDVCKFRNSWEESKLIEEVKTQIEDVRKNKDSLYSLFEQYMNSFLSPEEVDEQIQNVQVKLIENKNEINTLLRLVSKGYINDEQFKEQNEKLNEDRKSLENQLYKLQKIEDEKIAAKRRFDNYIKELDSLDIESLGEEPTKSNIILRTLIHKIESIEDQEKGIKSLKIIWNILDKNEFDIKKKQLPISIK